MAKSPGEWTVREQALRVLKPGGKLLGEEPTRGKGKVRRVREGKEKAEELFERLAEGGEDSPIPGVPVRRIKLPGVGYATYREISKTGPPTIDVSVNIEGLRNVKFKFVGSE